MQEQIQEAIRANLPQQTAGELRDYLADLEEKAAQLEHVKKDNEHLRSEIDKLSQVKHSLEREVYEWKTRERGIRERGLQADEREKDLAGREAELAVTVAELKAAEAEKRADAVTSVVHLVFQNNRYKHRVPVARSVAATPPVYDSEGNHRDFGTVYEGQVDMVDTESEG